MSLYKFIHMLLLKRYSIKTKLANNHKQRQSPKFFYFFKSCSEKKILKKITCLVQPKNFKK